MEAADFASVPESERDAAIMRRVLALALGGWGRVHPNPLVGAAVLRDDVVVGSGWHAEFGEQHAERMALEAAGPAARGATLYTALEPCTHHGKQPPCVDAIIAAGIAKVVVALRDPNPVAQGGVDQLRQAGIAVVVGLEAEAAARQNFRFLREFTPTSRPFVAIKLAVSMDGMVADSTGGSRWLSSDLARTWVHWLRAGFGGVAVGGETAIRDDARLTVRGAVTPRIPPTRVIFDRGGRLSPAHGIFAEAPDVPLIMMVASAIPLEHRQTLEHAGARVMAADDLPTALGMLVRAGVDSLLVEGGGRLAGALLHGGLVDRIYQIQSPLWLGKGVPAWNGLGEITIDQAPRWHVVERQVLGDDTLIVMEQ